MPGTYKWISRNELDKYYFVGYVAPRILYLLKAYEILRSIDNEEEISRLLYR